MRVNGLRSVARRVVPARAKPVVSRLYRTVRSKPWRKSRLWLTIPRLGWRIVCPCCRLRFRSLLTYRGRVNAVCPWCGAMERHRLLALYLRHRTEFLSAPMSLLHVAPEASVQRVLRRNRNLNYVDIDLNHPIPERRMDLTDLRFDDDVFDGILCSHVLEHIVDDRQAMRELCRVLKPTGLALVLVPQNMDLESTFEDPTVTSPDDRARLFGQSDHVRVYGLDFQQRLRAAGFNVELEKYIELLPESVVRRHALRRSFIYRCTKPAAAIH